MVKFELSQHYHFPILYDLLHLPYEVSIAITSDTSVIVGRGNAEFSPPLNGMYVMIHTHPFVTVKKNKERLNLKQELPLDPPTMFDYVANIRNGQSQSAEIVVTHEGLWQFIPSNKLAARVTQLRSSNSVEQCEEFKNLCSRIFEASRQHGKRLLLLDRPLNRVDVEEYCDNMLNLLDDEVGFYVGLHNWLEGNLTIEFNHPKVLSWSDLKLETLEPILAKVGEMNVLLQD